MKLNRLTSSLLIATALFAPVVVMPEKAEAAVYNIEHNFLGCIPNAVTANFAPVGRCASWYPAVTACNLGSAASNRDNIGRLNRWTGKILASGNSWSVRKKRIDSLDFLGETSCVTATYGGTPY